MEISERPQTNQPSEQPEPPRHGLFHNKLFGYGFLAVVLILIIGGVYAWQYGGNTNPPPAPLNETQTPPLQSSDFKDDELGIAFDVPESWGEVIVKNDFSSTQILREISFSNQSSVKLISFTKDRLYPADFERSSISTSSEVNSFCESQLRYLSVGDEPKTDKGQDLFRLNGAYNFGNCIAAPPFLNISEKTSEGGVGWVSLDDPKTAASEIELSRSIFWSLPNPIYASITLKVDVPDTTSDGFCKSQFYFGENDYQLYKSFGCLNHAEKELIEGIFRNFDSTQLASEVNFLVESFQVYSADNASSIYDNYFIDKTVFNDTGLEISIDYPSVFGEPKYDSVSRILSFPNDNNDSLRIEINTLADIAQKEKEIAECKGPCLSPLTSQDRWKEEKDILSQTSIGQIECPFGGEFCEIANVGDTKMIIRYYNQWPRTDGVRKEYAFYIDDKRFDLFTNSYSLYTHDLSEYRESENTDFTLKLVREILESIQIKK